MSTQKHQKTGVALVPLFLCVWALTSIMLPARIAVADNSCTLKTYSYYEDFSTKTYKGANTSTNNWPGTTGTGPAPKSGGWENYTSTANFGERVTAICAGDFNGDDQTDIVAISPNGGCHIEIFLNSSGTLTASSKVVIDSTCTNTAGAVLASGDVNKDGKVDFVVATVSNPLTSGAVDSAILYYNTGNSGSTPTFSKVDITSLLTSANVAWHVAGTQLVLKDWDGDGRDDLLVLSSSGTDSRVLLFPALPVYAGVGFSSAYVTLVDSTGFYTPIASNGTTASLNGNCMPTSGTTSLGGTALLVGDYDGDSLLDFFVASSSESRALFFTQNADGTMRREVDSAFTPGGILLGFSDDMDGDSTPDLTFIRSGNDCNGLPGEGYVILNYFNQAQFHAEDQPLTGIGGPADFGAVIDVNNDGMLDVIIGKSQGDGKYTIYSSKVVGKNSFGRASSSIISNIPSDEAGIVSAQITALTITSSFSGLMVYLSNDAGQNWETLDGSSKSISSIPANTELSGAKAHTFSHFGNQLMWRIELSATTGTYIKKFGLSYGTVDKSYYTRSNTASGIFSISGSKREYIYSAGFTYPGFEAVLNAYDITSLQAGTATGIEKISTSSGAVWEAGSLLQSRSGSSRSLWTSYPSSVFTPSPNNVILDSRVAFSTSEINAPTSNPNLATMMGIGKAEGSSTIDFLTDGMGQSDKWKFFDTGHSSPVIVNPPSQDPNYMGNSYANFIIAQSSRKPFVLIGSNDGALHAFDATTGVELWGYIPNNLIGLIKKQRGTDPNTGSYVYTHNSYVDGSVQVDDVYSGGSWHTIAVVGQAVGSGLYGNNYYFAVDVTTPTSPIPLWEFTEAGSVSLKSCDGNPKYANNCTANCSMSTTKCYYENSITDSAFLVSLTTPDASGGAAGLAEAEIYDDVEQSDSTPIATWNVISSGSTSERLSARSTAYIEATGTSACGGGSGTAVQPCALASYRFFVNSTSAGTLYPWFRIYNVSGQTNISWALDGNFVETLSPSFSSSTLNTWQWTVGSAMNLTAKSHTITVYMNQRYVDVDTVAVQKSRTSSPLSTFSATPNRVCDFSCSGSTCSTYTLSNPNNQEWPQCGVGQNLKCCPFGSQYFCSPVGSACSNPNSVMGQAFSKPAMGYINTTAGGKWAAFFASGYNNRNTVNVGRSIYAVDAYTGKPLGSWNLSDIPANSSNPNIEATIPGGVSLADVDDDGYIDRLYVGDLQGRMWKLNTSKQITLSSSGAMTNPNDYQTCVVFDAGNPTQSGTRVWAPIITKPAIVVLTAGTANVYFGTGGDDRAPSNIMYKFYSVRDSDTKSVCSTLNRTESSLSIANLEWVVGDGKTNTNPQATLSDSTSEGSVGEKYWADPVVVNGTSVYFSSLPGSIEQVNPCLNVQGQSKVYAYATQTFTDSYGVIHQGGQSILSGGKSYLLATGKIRNAAMVRGVTASNIVHGVTVPTAQNPTDLLVQQFDGSLMRLSTAGYTVGNPFKIIRWREISF